MPIPRWVAQVNKRVLNKREIERGVRPVLTHVGRTSGRSYQTPLDAHPVEGGYLMAAVYGSSSDWVRNVMAAGSARLTVAGEVYELVSPRLVTRRVAAQLLEDSSALPSGIWQVKEFLHVDVAA